MNMPPYPVPKSSCVIDPVKCDLARASWTSRYDAVTSTDGSSGWEQWYRPECSGVSKSVSSLDYNCYIFASGIHLLYWPSTLVQSTTYQCRGGTILKETVAYTGTTPVTAVVNNITYTSPTLYISFDDLWRSYPATTGIVSTSTKHNVIISMSSENLYSGQGHMAPGSYSFNFLDLTGPVPLAAYTNQPTCNYVHYNHPCETVFNDYFPNIVVPTELRTADPAFATCEIWPFALFDPPIALQPQNNLIDTATITPAIKPTGEPPSPSKTAGLMQVSKTVDPNTKSSVTGQASAQPPSQPAGSANSAQTQKLSAITASLSIPQPGPPSGVSPSAVSGLDPAVAGGFQQDPSGGRGEPQDIQQGSQASKLDDNTANGKQNQGNGGGGQGLAQTVRDPLGSHESSPSQTVPGGNGVSRQVSPGGTNGQQAPPQVGGQQAFVGQSGVVFSAGSQAYTAVQNGDAILVAGSSLSVGGSAVTINSKVISMATSGLVVGQDTVAFSSISPDPSSGKQGIVIPGGSLTAFQSNGKIIIGSSTLSVGGLAATINGQVISAASSGLVLAGSTIPLSAVKTLPSPAKAVVTLGNQVYTAVSGSIVTLRSVSLSLYGPAAIVSGQVVSLGINGVVVGSQTRPWSTPPSVPTTPTEAIFTLGNQVFTAVSGSAVTLGSVTLSLHGPAATISGEVISLGPNGIIIGSQTQSFSGISGTTLPTVGLGGFILGFTGNIPAGTGGSSGTSLLDSAVISSSSTIASQTPQVTSTSRHSGSAAHVAIRWWILIFGLILGFLR